MTTRITEAFAAAKRQGRPAFIAFVTAGDPNPDATVDIVLALERAGVDIVELGMPFSDPVIDGPIIQSATSRALKAGTDLHKVLDAARAIRAKAPKLGLVLYSYVNPLLKYGIAKLAKDAADAGIDGMLTVDLPIDLDTGEDDMGVLAQYRANNLDPVFLVAPTTTPERRRRIAKAARGFIYLVALNGVTGVKDATAEGVAPIIADLKTVTDVPIAVGVGIKTPAQVASIGQLADGVVVGSALVNLIGEAGTSADLAARVEAMAAALVGALPKAA